MKAHDKLEAEFNKKVKTLQSRCIHGKHEPVMVHDWFGRWHKKMCSNCHKYLEDNKNGKV